MTTSTNQTTNTKTQHVPTNTARRKPTLTNQPAKKRKRTIKQRAIGSIIDDYGVLKAQIADLEEKKLALHTEILRRGIEFAHGHYFQVSVSTYPKAFLDSTLVKEEQGQKWWDEHCYIREITTVKIGARSTKK
jgi:hypothetical protein